MVKMCYICDYKADKNKPITLHGFPKNPATREKWLTSCNLTQADNVTNVVICSQHFADEDVVKIDMKVRLKTGAIPTINVPNPINPIKIEEEDILDAIPHTNYNINPIKIEEKDILDAIPHTNYNMNPIKIEEEDILDAIPHTNYNFDTEFDESNVCPHEEVCTDVNEKIVDVSPKRKFHPEPTYVSKISILHFRTPSIASRTLKLIKEAYGKKVTQVKSLQRQNQRLRKRVDELEDMIRHWKECDE